MIFEDYDFSMCALSCGISLPCGIAILAKLCDDVVGDRVKALNKVNEVHALVRCAFGDVPYSMKQKISAHSSKIGTSTGVS